MATTRDDGPVLVAVGNPDHVQQLVRTAGDLARDGSRTTRGSKTIHGPQAARRPGTASSRGTVRIVTVAVTSRDSPFGVVADETILREFADDSHELVRLAETPPGVTVERDVVVARSVARGVLSAVEETDPTALVVGWQGRTRRTDALLGTTVDRLVERAPCDLYVERVGREANGVSSVLLPVAGGPHVEVAATAARVIAERNDARVHVFSVETSDSGAENGTAAGYAAEARELLEAEAGTGLRVETETVEAEDVTDAIVEAIAAGEHDVVVLGATRQGPLRGRLVGSVPRRVVERTDATVILARDGDVVGGVLGRIGGLLRR